VPIAVVGGTGQLAMGAAGVLTTPRLRGWILLKRFRLPSPSLVPGH
jgi:hypothetical protein